MWILSQYDNQIRLIAKNSHYFLEDIFWESAKSLWI